MKKGVAMSFEVMVAAALALIVLIIMVLLFTSKMQPFNTQTKDCATIGGVCTTSDKCGVMSKTAYECDGDLVCCINYCIQDGWDCVTPCENAVCNGACPEGSKRKFSAGCPNNMVCCGSE